ncbi:hypothetical protein [Citrobacter portucalensis]|uniref:hypothetical protein n=1 Tax=Citrobacter portucalensis TaxID=1639133 RepID=UPI00226B526B|nr:hypothetical protein [Citrobacter portucalensis]MCX8981218.1 hypothetical protein [Citrobacter portucalensis]
MNIFSTKFTKLKLVTFPFSRKKIALVLFPLLIAGCDGATPETQEAPPVSVESVTVKEQPFKLQTTLPGRISTALRMRLMASGRVILLA